MTSKLKAPGGCSSHLRLLGNRTNASLRTWLVYEISNYAC